jgi:hypothetical protein
MNDFPLQERPAAVEPIMALISRAATDPAMDVAKLHALLDAKERFEREEARKAFEDAMVQFKDKRVSVGKNKRVHFQSSKGTTDYWHATLSNVCELVGAALAEVGISHRWETEQKDRIITVTCILTQRLGHSTRTTLSGIPDDTGNKNAIQQVGSTVTYLQRYTLMAATGTASVDQDNDGGRWRDDEPEEPQWNPWTEALKAEASAAANEHRYAAWWKEMAKTNPKFCAAAIKTNEHLDFRAKDKE